MKLTAALLERLSLPAIYERGEHYFRSGRVAQLVKQGGQVEALVRGSRDYRQLIDLSADSWAATCTCPYEGEGICKHLVAAGLAIVAGQFSAGAVMQGESEVFRVSLDQVRETFLAQLKPGRSSGAMPISSIHLFWSGELDAHLRAGRVQDGLRLLLGVYEGIRSALYPIGAGLMENVFVSLEQQMIQHLGGAELPVPERKACIEWIFRRWDKYEAAYDGVSQTAIRYSLAHFEGVLIALSVEKIAAHFTSMKMQAYGITARQMPLLHRHVQSLDDTR